MSTEFRIVYFAHSLRSDWNNGNAHFLRGLLRSMIKLGHHVTVFEQENNWSILNLQDEQLGPHSLAEFKHTYADLNIQSYAQNDSQEVWRLRLIDAQLVILHEWNMPALAQRLLGLRRDLGYRLLFHDTHHRASSSPEQIQQFGLEHFDGILAFGETLKTIYRDRLKASRVWTFHEAADTTIFYPTHGKVPKNDVVWIGNWGEGERSSELREYLLRPAEALKGKASFAVYGVRYPDEGLAALHQANIFYKGYLPNLDAPATYATARLTLHVPRQQYSLAMPGIPTIRVFEALACGIPLISAPWQDTENLFRDGDFCFVDNASAMTSAIQELLCDPATAIKQAQRGLETILARHTCDHRARELTSICEEVTS